MRKMRWAGVMSFLLGAILVGTTERSLEGQVVSKPAHTAKEARPKAPLPSSIGGHQLTAEDFGPWVDGYLSHTMKRDSIPGAVVVVVKDGKVLFQRGYGYADVASKRLVNPETTLFRPGSVSKLITWTAVMQQVEQGRLNLDQDINAYLDFKIPPMGGRPITLRNLLTHTTGFEDTLRDILSSDVRQMPALGEYLRSNLPRRLYAPGQMPAYSNYGAALAGYIVQRVTREPFTDYVDRHIFAPLEMRHSTFREPVPASLAKNMASGYALASTPPKPFENFTIVPAGSASMSGADMAKFMIAHLKGSSAEGPRLLRPATLQYMQGYRYAAISPMLNRMALGFWEYDRGAHPIIGHQGDTVWFHSILQLYPKDGVGIFYSQNGTGRNGAGHQVRDGLVAEFKNRYFPSPAGVVEGASDGAIADADRIVGAYQPTYPMLRSSFLSILSLFGQVEVTADDQGQIRASSVVRPDGTPIVFRRTGPLLWKAADGGEVLAAKPVKGPVQVWGASPQSFVLVHVRTPFWRDARWLKPMVGLALLVGLGGALIWARKALARRSRQGFSMSSRDKAHACASVSNFAASTLIVVWFAFALYIASNYFVSSKLSAVVGVLEVFAFIVLPAACYFTGRYLWEVRPASNISGGIFSFVGGLLLFLSSIILLWTAVVFNLLNMSQHF